MCFVIILKMFRLFIGFIKKIMNREGNHCPCVLTLQNPKFTLLGTRKVITYGLYYLYRNDQFEVER